MMLEIGSTPIEHIKIGRDAIVRQISMAKVELENAVQKEAMCRNNLQKLESALSSYEAFISGVK